MLTFYLNNKDFFITFTIVICLLASLTGDALLGRHAISLGMLREFKRIACSLASHADVLRGSSRVPAPRSWGRNA